VSTDADAVAARAAAWIAANREGIEAVARRCGMSIADVEVEYAKMYREQIEEQAANA